MTSTKYEKLNLRKHATSYPQEFLELEFIKTPE